MLGADPAGLPLQHDRQLAVRPARRRPTRGARTRSSGWSPRRRRSSTSTRSRASSAGPTSTGSPAPGTRSWPAKAPRSRRPSRAVVGYAVTRALPTGTRPLLVFLNEVAGGRKLLQAVRERAPTRRLQVVVAAPQNQPAVGQLIDRDELRDAARARVEVTMAVLAEFGIDSVGEVHGPGAGAGARRRGPRPRARARSCSPASTAPASGSPARTSSSGPEAGRAGGHVHPHPGADRRRRDPLGRQPHARRRDPDGRTRRTWSRG